MSPKKELPTLEDLAEATRVLLFNKSPRVDTKFTKKLVQYKKGAFGLSSKPPCFI